MSSTASWGSRLRKSAVVGAALLALAGPAFAAVQQHTFSITGTGGETGTGTFTWDDALVTSGSSLAISNLLSVSISLSGGNVAGGSTTFTKSDCTQSFLDVTPDFVSDINFWCDNGTNSLQGVEPYINDLNSGASTLTFAAGTTAPVVQDVTPAPVPTLGTWAMALMGGLLALGSLVVLRRRG